MILKKPIALITSLFFMSSLCTNGLSTVYSSSNKKENSVNNKITEELATVINSSTNSVTVGIKIKDLDHSIIDKMIENRSDYCVAMYNDINTYTNNVLTDIIKETELEYGYEMAHIISVKNPNTGVLDYTLDTYFDEKDVKSQLLLSLDKEQRRTLFLSKVSEVELKKYSDENFGNSPITKKISDDINGFMAIKRKCVIEAYLEYNNNFIEKFIDLESVITNYSFAPFIVANLSVDTIDLLAESSEVEKIEYINDDVQPEPSLYDSLIDTNIISDNNGVSENLTGYTGAGVKVGIMEAEMGKYDSNYVMLNGCTNLNYMYLGNVDNGVQSNHATLVTSIIKGKSYETYRGVAPDSQIYEIGFNNDSHYEECIRKFAENNISVINCSANTDFNDGNKSYIDYAVDCAVENLGIIFVSSAGNTENYVCSPALASNVISVGNINTKFNAPYSTYPDSSYSVAPRLPNKPDIVAPGTNIYLPSLGISTGTSYSAPIVTGVIAQMIQCRPSLLLNHASTAAKSLLLLGANPDIISPINNETKMNGSNDNLLRNKTGAGIVDAKKTIDILERDGYILREMYMNIDRDGRSSGGTARYESFEAGDKIRVVLTFSEYPIRNDSQYDLDLAIYNSSMNRLAHSYSFYNNVEIIEYTIPSNGNYLIITELASSNLLANERIPCSMVISITQ